MDNRTVLIGVALFMVSAGASFYAADLVASEPEEQKFRSYPDVRASSGNAVNSFSFDNHTMDLMFEGGSQIKAYLDINQDGSADMTIEDLVSDGQTHTVEKTVTFNTTSYRLYFRYSSSENYIELYQVREM